MITSQNMSKSEEAHCPQVGAPNTWPLRTRDKGLLHTTCLAMHPRLPKDPGGTRPCKHPAAFLPTEEFTHAYSDLECISRGSRCVSACWKSFELLDDSYQKVGKNSTFILCDPIPNLWSYKVQNWLHSSVVPKLLKQKFRDLPFFVSKAI